MPSLADLDTLLIDSDATVATHLAPHFGASVTPIDGLRLSATIHSPQAQFHRLLARSVRKELGDDSELVRDEVPDDAVGGTPRGPIPGREGLQTNNPGFPSFASQGFLAGIGVRATLAY